jgi:hypothetical protein
MPQNARALAACRRAASINNQQSTMEGSPHMTDDTNAVPQASQMPASPPPAQQIPADAIRRLPYSHGKRTGYGLLWAGWTLLLTIAGFAGLFGGQILTGLLALVLAALAGRYDHRIWTWRARRLLFLIIW